MAIRPIILQVLIILSCHISDAQNNKSRDSKVLKYDPWTYTVFPGDIIKTTFSLPGTIAAPQISNAVIMKPLKTSADKFIQYIEGDTRFINTESSATLLRYFETDAYKGFQFSLTNGEKIFGTGERSIPLDRRGYKLNLYNSPAYGYGLNAENLNYSVPFIISSKGYGLFFDNPSLSYLDIGKTDSSILEYGASAGELTFYVIPGKNVDEILRKYQALVGTQPIPARWVLGNLMSRFGYRSEKQLMQIVDSMHTQKIPFDAVILDLFWFGDSIKGTLGNLAWTNKKAWPDPSKMIGKLKSEHIQTILITEPFVLNTTSNYEVSKKYHAVDSLGKPFVLTDFYFGNGGLIDIFKKDAQNWFWSKYKTQIQKGIAGWWGDLGEPEKHPEAMYHNLRDLGFNKLFKSNDVHNIYGHFWDKMLFDKYTAEYPKVRLFNLNRSGYAGSARYSVFPWSGDVSRSWSGLQAQLPLMLGMSMSGVPYIHADAGGFAGGEGDMELYIRWLQFATFTPVFKPHGTALGDLDPNVKNIPSEAALFPEPYRSIARKSIQLRYKLLPYNYTLAYEQAKFGKPLVRPLFYYGAYDPELYKAGDEYFWGDNILVAPVLEKAATHRKLYLPAGSWYNFFNDFQELGGRWLEKEVDPLNIPVYVKEGSFIPMFESNTIKSTYDYSGKNITVKYYPWSKQSAFIMFDDDGVTNNTLSTKKYELLKFQGITKEGQMIIKISSSERFLKQRRIKIILPEQYKMVSANGKKVEEKNNAYTVIFTGRTVSINLLVKYTTENLIVR